MIFKMPEMDDVIDVEKVKEDVREGENPEKYNDADFDEFLGEIDESNENPEGQVEGQETPVNEPPKMTKEEEEATVGAMVEIAGNLIVKIRHVPDESKEKFLEEYHHMTEQILILIGFGKALATLPVSQMKPSTVIMLGIGLLVVMGFLVRVPKDEHNLKTNMPPTPNRMPNKPNESPQDNSQPKVNSKGVVVNAGDE